MTPEDIKKTIIDALTRIAPEIDPASIETSTSFRDQLDLDSMDFLNFVLALHDRLGIDIPETDYPLLYSLDSALSYLASKPIANPTSRSARESTKPGSSTGV
jgi:acyl carrier protein